MNQINRSLTQNQKSAHLFVIYFTHELSYLQESGPALQNGAVRITAQPAVVT